MGKRVLVWANNYYGKSLGVDAPILDYNNPNNTETIEQAFLTYFEKPLAYMLTGTDTVPESKEALNNALVKLSQGPVTDWIYLMKFWVDKSFFIYTGNFEEDLKNCFIKTQNEMRVLFATAGVKSKDIALHTFNGRIIDDLPKKVFVYPKGLRAHFNGRLLSDIAQKDPTLTTAIERAALQTALSGNFIEPKDLREEPVTVPKGPDVEVSVLCSAVSLNLPPKEYSDIARALPSSLVSQGRTQLSLIKDYMETTEVSDEVREYVNRYSTVVMEADPVEITDDVVLAYLADKYGVYADSVSELRVHSKLPTFMCTDIDAELLKGSAAELINAFREEDPTELSTLDVIIQNYCVENAISEDCTIAQLLESICHDVHPVPHSTRDLLVKDITSAGLDENTTLSEYIKGEKHVPIDPVDVMLDFMVNNPQLFPEEAADVVRSTLLYDKELVIPTKASAVESVIATLSLSTEEAAALKSAVLSERTYELKQTSMPKLSEEGYIVGEYLLRRAREEISSNASFELRSELTPILYTFLRLLMCDMHKEKQSVIGFIDGKIKEAGPKSAKILTEAKALLP